MSKPKPNYSTENLRQLRALCEREGYEIEQKSPDQYRVYGATHVIDFWVARMVYHRLKGEDIKAMEGYHKGLDWQFNLEQVSSLLATGKFKGSIY